MVNEYQKSICTYEELRSEYEGFIKKQATGIQINEEDLLSYLFKLKNTWSMMFALEQRDFCRQSARYIGILINEIRSSSGRSSVWGTGQYRGIFGEEKCRIGIMDNLLDDKLSPSELFDLNGLEKMAEIVDRLAENQ